MGEGGRWSERGREGEEEKGGGSFVHIHSHSHLILLPTLNLLIGTIYHDPCIHSDPVMSGKFRSSSLGCIQVHHGRSLGSMNLWLLPNDE